MIHGPNTSNMVKHIGVFNDKRCVIVIQLPETPHLVHIIDTESLTDLYHQNLMEIVNSPEAQNAQWLGEVMSRRMLHDGTNALRSFYEKNLIQQVPASNLLLSPRPNVTIPFTQVYPSVADPLADKQDPFGVRDQQFDDVAAQEQIKLDENLARINDPSTTLHNQHVQNFASDKVNVNQQIGMGLLAEAQMLEAEAAAKRVKAAQYGVASEPTSRMPTVSEVSDTVSDADQFIDTMTGKSYKTAGALKGAITRREKASNS